jgi:hypothetical protein
MWKRINGISIELHVTELFMKKNSKITEKEEGLMRVTGK